MGNAIDPDDLGRIDLGRIDLDSLVRRIDACGVSPLDAIALAVDVSRDLAAIGEALTDHYVQAGRAAELSWAQIGTSLGVTRQAARQRFGALYALTQTAPFGDDGLRDKAGPFAALEDDGAGGLRVRLEVGGPWYRLAELDGVAVGTLVEASRRAFRTRWAKRLGEDLDAVYDAVEKVLGPSVEAVLVDAGGRRLRQTLECTIAKRKAAWHHNHETRS